MGTRHPWILRKLQPRWSSYEPTLLQNSDRYTVCQIYPYLTSLRTYLPRKRPQNQQIKKKSKKKKKKKKVRSRFTTRSLRASSPSCWSVTQHPWILRKLQQRWSSYEPTLLQNSDRYTVCQIFPYPTSLRTYLPRKRPQNQQRKKKSKKKKKKKKDHSRFTTLYQHHSQKQN